jgi:thiamine-phosphate pyrophosphorylase
VPQPWSPDGARAALAGARLYLCTDSRSRQGDLADFLDAVLRNGVDIVQLREKGLEALSELWLLQVVAAAAERHGKLFAVNDRADIALASGAPVLHLGQDDLPVPLARRIVGDDIVIGRSTHSPSQASAADLEPGVDYFCVGPTWATPTKPGRPAAGLSLLAHAAGLSQAAGRPYAAGLSQAAGRPYAGRAQAARAARPWFAIGGIESLDRLDEVIAHGARRVVVVRAITEADDPGAAAAAFAEKLHSPSPSPS